MPQQKSKCRYPASSERVRQGLLHRHVNTRWHCGCHPSKVALGLTLRKALSFGTGRASFSNRL